MAGKMYSIMDVWRKINNAADFPIAIDMEVISKETGFKVPRSTHVYVRNGKKLVEAFKDGTACDWTVAQFQREFESVIGGATIRAVLTMSGKPIHGRTKLGNLL